jgi:hypothetical protein
MGFFLFLSVLDDHAQVPDLGLQICGLAIDRVVVLISRDHVQQSLHQSADDLSLEITDIIFLFVNSGQKLLQSLKFSHNDSNHLFGIYVDVNIQLPVDRLELVNLDHREEDLLQVLHESLLLLW